MKPVKFSRHAKRRIKLYNISEEVIIEIVKNVKSTGKQEVVEHVSNFKKPIKVVFDVQEAYIVIITAYPLKRSIK
jgi:hypothetical protein